MKRSGPEPENQRPHAARSMTVPVLKFETDKTLEASSPKAEVCILREARA